MTKNTNEPLWVNTHFENINYLDPLFFDALKKAVKQLKTSSTPARFNLEYSLILASLPERNPTNETYYQTLESIANESILFSSDIIIPQSHQLVAAGTDIKCGAKLLYQKTYREEEYEEDEVYVIIDSISAPELHLEININTQTCEGGWFDLFAQRRNWDSSNLPYIVTRPTENELRMTIDENNYVVINLDILFKPEFSVEYFDPKLKQVISITNRKLKIFTNSLFQLTHVMMIDYGFFDEVFNIRSISSDTTSDSYDHLITEDDDLIIQEGDKIILITVQCSLCKSAKQMPVKPNVINDEYLCDSCYKQVEATTSYLKNPNTQFIVVEMDGKLGCLQKIPDETPNSLKFELFDKFKALRPKKRKRYVDGLLVTKEFECSSLVAKSFLVETNKLNTLILQLRHEGYHFNQHSPVDDICFNITI